MMNFCLVEPTHPGNIGAAARAIKTMGFKHLLLVAPKCFPSAEAIAMAAGAKDILEQAQVFNTLQEALASSSVVFGTSARSRSIPWPLLNPREAAQKADEYSNRGQITFVFGRESSGLSNEELSLCHYHVHIPSNPEYSSLNLAQAVQIIAYENRMQTILDEPKIEQLESEPLATQAMLEIWTQRVEQFALETGFLNPENPRYLVQRFRRILAKAQLTKSELNMLQGLFRV